MPELQHKDTETIEVEKLIPYANNPKEHPEEQVNEIASSIKNYGFVQPIVTDADNEIIIGHGRLEAAKKLGLDEVPVIKHEDITEAEAQALRLADNKIADTGMEQEKLAVELDQLTDQDNYDELVTGFTEERTSEILDEYREQTEGELEEPDAPEMKEVETDIQEGDVFRLNEHILVCGDSSEAHVREKSHPEGKPDIILTDPPYGIDIVSDNKVGVSGPPADDKGSVGGGGVVEANTYKPVAGDDTDFDPSFLVENYDTKLIIFGGNHFTESLPQKPHWLVWDKKTKAEMDKNKFSDAELIWTNINKKTTDIYRFMWSGMITEGNQDQDERIHPTQKPVGLLGDILKDYSEEGDTVFDPFAGSGSLLMAAEQLNRQARVIELDPYYCQLIIDRWEDFTGQQAEKLKNT